jgi:4-amino-4-deoxy-L-arabinose transferase-like glycosyltransferase
LPRTISAEKLYLFAILLAALTLRLFQFLNVSAIEMDGISYVTMAEQFTKGQFGAALNNVFPPVYPISVAFFHLIIPDVETAGRLASLVFALLLICLAFLFVRKYLGGGAKALWVAFLLAFHPLLIRYSAQVLSESLATLLFAMTVFSFYVGWQEERRSAIAVSGICLALTYLTRPEYLIFYAPLILLLLGRKRIIDSLVLLIPFVVLGSFYIVYLWSQTGMWMVSRKATLSPFVSLGTFFTNLPLVSYEFLIAIFPLFFLCALFGFKKVEKPYKNLIVVIVIFHITSLSFICHATKRYSVEFVPFCMVFAAEGIYVVNEYLKKIMSKRLVYCSMIAVIVLAGIFQSYTASRPDRVLQKKAGLYLLQTDPGSIVASRLPIVCFYSKGTCVTLAVEMSEDKTLARFLNIVTEKKVKYLAFDEQTEKELPFLRDYLSNMLVDREFRESHNFLRIYKLAQ